MYRFIVFNIHCFYFIFFCVVFIDLEEELNKDLQEFEVVAGDAVHIDEEELERELAEMDIK